MHLNVSEVVAAIPIEPLRASDELRDLDDARTLLVLREEERSASDEPLRVGRQNLLNHQRGGRRDAPGLGEITGVAWVFLHQDPAAAVDGDVVERASGLPDRAGERRA